MAFTLAEMMVVLLIMSIVLACLAPAMTTKMKADQSIQTSPWKWARNNTDAYFSVNSAQSAMIGQSEKGVGEDAKLIVNNSTGLDDMILFKNGNNVLGHLSISNNNALLLGTLRNGTTLGTASTSLGRNNTVSGNYSTSAGYSNTVSGNYSTSVGYNNTVSGSYSTAVGYYNKVEGNSSIAIGYWTKAPHKNSVAIGYGTASGDTESGTNTGWSTAVGYNTTATGYASVAYGAEAKAYSDRSVALGSTTEVSDKADVAMGSYSYASGDGALAIGRYSCAKGTGSVAVGTDNCERDWGTSGVDKSKFKTHDYATGLNGAAYSLGAVSIGPWTMVYGEYGIGIGSVNKELFTGTPAIHTKIGTGAHRSIAIGHDNLVEGIDAVSIGYGARANGANTVSIGKNACRNVTGSNKVCIGADSGPDADSDWAKDNNERIFIGSKSSFNNEPAVLEVHNGLPSKAIYGEDAMDSQADFDGGKSNVVVNGNLIVRGSLVLDEMDGKNPVFFYRMLERGDLIQYLEVAPFSNSYLNFYEASSDRRLKYVGKESTDGLEKIKQLKVFNYTFKKDENKTPRVGVMAQDLQKIFPNAVKKGADGFLTIRMEDMFYAVINAIKELDAKYQAHEKRIYQLEKENKELKTRLEKLEAKIK